jgi:WD40 repeat protein
MCVCGKQLRVKDELAGKKVRCPACQQPVPIPVPAVTRPALPEIATPVGRKAGKPVAAEEESEKEPPRRLLQPPKRSMFGRALVLLVVGGVVLVAASGAVVAYLWWWPSGSPKTTGTAIKLATNGTPPSTASTTDRGTTQKPPTDKVPGEAVILAAPRLKLPSDFRLARIGFSGDGHWLAAIADFRLTVWEVASGETKLSKPLGLASELSSAFVNPVFTPDNKAVIVVKNGVPGVGRCALETGEVEWLYEHDDQGLVFFVGYSKDNRLLAVYTAKNKTVVVVDVNQKKILATVTFDYDAVFPMPILSAGMSPDGKHFTFMDSHRLWLLNLEPNPKVVMLSEFVKSGNDINQMLISSPSTPMAAVYSSHFTLGVGTKLKLSYWDLTTEKVRESRVVGQDDWVRKWTFSPDAQWLMGSVENRKQSPPGPDTLIIWEVATWKKLATVGELGFIPATALTPDKKTLAVVVVADGKHTLQVWDLPPSLTGN